MSDWRKRRSKLVRFGWSCTNNAWLWKPPDGTAVYTRVELRYVQYGIFRNLLRRYYENGSAGECPYCGHVEMRKPIESGLAPLTQPTMMYRMRCSQCGRKFWEHERQERRKDDGLSYRDIDAFRQEYNRTNETDT
jgi:DNA-directed RNA polymerase subunit RPC12/RpoP